MKRLPLCMSAALQDRFFFQSGNPGLVRNERRFPSNTSALPEQSGTVSWWLFVEFYARSLISPRITRARGAIGPERAAQSCRTRDAARVVDEPSPPGPA
jgi:hypothetical protein